MPHISGSDAAGVVVEVGDDVTMFKKGDRVVSHSNLSCRKCDLCISGREYDCNDRLVWGFQTGPLDGAYAEYTKLPEVNIQPGQTVLIMGGTSGVGSIGIQIAKLFNCTVIATAGNADKMEVCKKLGADYVVNHRELGLSILIL
jgi:alcohol dehydrogenase